MFIIITVLAVAIGTAVLAYNINANQIDRYYKQVAFDSAVNFASFVDGDYLIGLDLTQKVEPTISTGDWGWLCSAYAPVCDSKGEIVCQIGCDFGMQDVMAERHRSLMYIILTAFGLTIIVLIGAVLLINRIVIRLLDSLTAEMKKFRPRENATYEEAGVVNLDIASHDEINELYDGIRSMQINIIDACPLWESCFVLPRGSVPPLKGEEGAVSKRINIRTEYCVGAAPLLWCNS